MEEELFMLSCWSFSSKLATLASLLFLDCIATSIGFVSEGFQGSSNVWRSSSAGFREQCLSQYLGDKNFSKQSCTLVNHSSTSEFTNSKWT